jgi:acyl phosphate:glycerol-3-phosphate acyltransferase
LTEAFAIAIGYLLGSIPFGYLAGRLNGVDLRTVGSGNTGAANVFRNVGRGWGIAVAALDIGKGAGAALIAKALTDAPWPILAGGAAVVGAIFPVWLRFRGGKGVAVGAGVILGLMPLVSLALVPLWFGIVLITRYTSLASIACAAAFTPLAWAFGLDWQYVALAGAMSALVLYRHRANMARLIAGREARIELRGRRARAARGPAGAPPPRPPA